MSRQRPTLSIDGQQLAVQITDDGSRTLIDPQSGVAYHSASGALSESADVYFRNSGVESRLNHRQSTSVLEIGLGTGMSLLLTLCAAKRAGTELRYTAVENAWIDANLLRQLEMDKAIGDPPLVQQFIDWRETIPAQSPNGLYTWEFSSQHRVLVFCDDLRSWLGSRSDPASDPAQPRETFDAIYFDPFDPAVNPELWRLDVLRGMFAMLNTAGRLVTYCVNRQIRDTLTLVGFEIQRVRGPAGGKREVMIATKPAA